MTDLTPEERAWLRNLVAAKLADFHDWAARRRQMAALADAAGFTATAERCREQETENHREANRAREVLAKLEAGKQP